MKKVIVLLLAVCLLISATGCSALNDVAAILSPKEAVFTVDDFNLQITANTSFHQSTAGDWDLQITNNQSYISVMAFRYGDLPSGKTPLDIYDMQNEDLFGKRTNVSVIEKATTQNLPQYELTQSLYSAERDGTKNYYGSYLIDFPEDETLAWVLITATPSYFEGSRESLHNIVCSLAITK